MNHLNQAYDEGTFGVSRRTFVKLAAVAGVTAAGGMLIFPSGTAEATFTQPETPGWASLTGDKVRFTVHSDTHFNGMDVDSKFPYSFEQIYQAVPDCVLHVFDGDSTNGGTAAEYASLTAATNASILKPAIHVMGNHEYQSNSHNALNSPSVLAYKNFLGTLTTPGTPQMPGGSHDGQLYVHYVAEGYHFIAASCNRNYWYGDAFDESGTTPVSWMKAELEAAATADPGKPIFLFTHHPFVYTVHYTPTFNAGWTGNFNSTTSNPDNTDFYDEISAKYPQVIHFSGHTHIPAEDPRSIYQAEDAFTMVQTATFGNNFWMQGGKNADGHDYRGGTGGHPDDGYDANQCILVEIDPNNNHELTIRRMDFRRGGYIGTPWVFSATDKSTWEYTPEKREATSKAPLVDEGPAVLVPLDTITETSASFTVLTNKVHADTSGVSDDIVMSYRVEILDAEGTKFYEACFMSDYYKAPQNQPVEFTRPLFGASLTTDTSYILKVFAQNPWKKETLVGEVIFSTKGADEVPIIPAAAVLAVDFSAGNPADTSETPHAHAPFGAPIFETVPQFAKQVAHFDGDSAYGYDFAEEDYEKLATASTKEILFQFNAAPTSGYWDIFSSGQGGGHWLEYYPDNSLYHYFTDGSTYTSSTVMPGVWTHVVATHDGNTMKFYHDGKLVDEVEAPGSFDAPGSDLYRWFIGADIDGYGDPQAHSKAKVAFAYLSCGEVMSAEAIKARYLSVAPVELVAPTEPEFNDPTVTNPCILPAVSTTTPNGDILHAVPSVTDPEGNPVPLYITTVPSEASLSVRATSGEPQLYSFVPSIEGTYSATYAAGYSVASTEFTVSPVPTSGGGTGGGSGTGGGGGTSEGGGSGSGSGSSGSSGSGSSSGNWSNSNSGKPLSATGDKTVGIGLLASLAAVAGAGVVVGKAILKGELSSTENDA